MANTYEFKKNGESLQINNITATEGLGYPVIDIASKAKGWRRDGRNIQWLTYGERIFSLSFDVTDNAVAERRKIYAFFADKGFCDFVATVDGKAYTLKDVVIAGDSDHSMPEGVMLPVVLQFMAGQPLFQVETDEDWTSISGNKTLTIDNDGDMLADLILEVKGTFSNLKVENLTTGEEVVFSKSVANKTILIDSKDWLIDIVDTENGWPYCTEDSRPPKLAKGENSVKITVTGQARYRKIEYYASL